jgi:hypothetical protein
MKSTICAWSLAVVLGLSAGAIALVNPTIQPSEHVYPLYKHVIGCKVTAVDDDKRTITMKVTNVISGDFKPAEVTITVPAAAAQAQPDDQDQKYPPLLEDTNVGQTIVAFVGKARKENSTEVQLYADHWWHKAQADEKDPSKWEWQQNFGDEMYGTFNGAPERLLEMMAETASGRVYFPAIPFTKFIDGPALPKLGGPCRGVALCDLSGDGLLDAYICSPAGDKLLIQTQGVKFTDATEAAGLGAARSVSVSAGDVNADGKMDLLLDGAIYLQGDGGKFARSELVARAQAPQDAKGGVKLGSFVDVNGDGYPDVVLSIVGGGLELYLNPGSAGGAFTNATAAAGLDKKECGAGGTGFFAWGDFSGDGKCDLYYGVGEGLILVQGDKGVFAPAQMKVRMSYDLARGKGEGLTGAGAFAALWSPQSTDLVAAGDMNITIVGNRGGAGVNLTGYGNETQQCESQHLGTLPEDFNADGTMDLMTISRDVESANMFHTNRGYGSYMRDSNYPGSFEQFPKSFDRGALGAAAGDVNGDGAVDLLLGGADGQPVLLINDSLSLRKPTANPLWHDRKQQQTRLLNVRVTGKLGVVGAVVSLADEKGNCVGTRIIGSGVLTGCRGPDLASLAVREGGKHVLTVRFSDGKTLKKDVEIGKEKLTQVTAAHEDAK